MKLLYAIAACLLFAASGLMGQTNPVPLIYQPLHPASVEPGHSSFTLTVRGTGFVSGAVVVADGAALQTRFISGNELKAKVPAPYVAKPRTSSITVVNPGTIASNVVYFTVRDSSPTVHMGVDPYFTAPDSAVAAGDFNNDGKLDIAVGRENDFGGGWEISLYQGKGNGTFADPIDTVLTGGYELAEIFNGMITADANGDGWLDLAVHSYYYYVCYCGCPTSAILLNNGDGTFSDKLANFQNHYSFFTSFADVNGDGNLDAFEVNNCADGTPPSYGALLGDGDGSFHSPQPKAPFPGDFVAVGLAAFGDFNADGKLDLALPGLTGQPIANPTIGVLLGNADGTFGPVTFYNTPYGGFQAFVGDLNGDSILDLIGDDACVLLGVGNGTFVPRGTCNNIGSQSPSVLADFNGDGKLDFVTMAGYFFDVFLGNGDGTFQDPIMFFANGTNGSFFTYGPPLGDFNNDGKLDFVKGGTPELGVQKPSN